MNKRLKQGVAAGLVMLGIGGLARQTQAATTDTMTVSVTPTVTYGVTISSPFAQGYVFGSIALGASTLSTVAITLNTTGATGPEYFGLSVSNTSGNWTATASAPGQDTFRLGAKMGVGQPVIANTTDFLLAAAVLGSCARHLQPRHRDVCRWNTESVAAFGNADVVELRNHGSSDDDDDRHRAEQLKQSTSHRSKGWNENARSSA